MIAFLLIIIAILLFVIAKSLFRQSERYGSAGCSNTKSALRSTSAPAATQIITSPKADTHYSYWQSWTKEHPSEAIVIEQNIDRKMSDITDQDAKEIIDAFYRMAHANNITDWAEIKPLMLRKLTEMVDELGKVQALAILDSAIQQEVEHTHAHARNTGTFIALTWLKQAMKDTQNINGPNTKTVIKNSENCSFMTSQMPKNKVYTDAEKNEIIELFKEEYISQIMTAIGENKHISLFAKGYDSPIAMEIMNIMYSYLRNDKFIDKAKSENIWNDLMFEIIEETNKITDKYCDSDIQECIEFFNFPEKSVITSRRCIACGSRRVFCEEIGQYECMECGCVWHASHGRNTYSRT